MSTHTYARSPDSFWLILAGAVDGLTAAPFETAYGPTDEILSFYDGTLIGRVWEDAPEGHTIIRLAPTLMGNSQYPWPTLSEFQLALSRLLDSDVPFELGCEQDADQSPVERLSDAKSASLALAQVVDFCAGLRDDCPSFRYAFRPVAQARLKPGLAATLRAIRGNEKDA